MSRSIAKSMTSVALAGGLVAGAMSSSNVFAAPAPVGTTALTSFDGVFDSTGAGSYTGGNAEIPAFASSNRMFRYDRNITVSPGDLGAGNTATYTTHITANAAALGNGTSDPFPTMYVGLLSEQGQNYSGSFISPQEVFGPTQGGNPAYPDHDGEGIIYFQSNTLGQGVAWGNRFYDASGNFVFGAAQQGGGYPNDDATGTAPAIYSSADLTVTLFDNNQYQLSVTYYDVNGNPVTSGASPFGFPTQTSPLITLPGAASTDYFPFVRIGNGSTDPGWAFDVSGSSLTVTPEPASLGTLVLGGVMFGARRRRLQK